MNSVLRFCQFALLALFLFPQALFAEEIITKMGFLDKIQTDEEENPLFWPTFVHIDPVTDELYVIDGRGRFILYTPDLFPIFTVGKEKGLDQPMGLAVDLDGAIYVSLAATKENPRPRIAVINACLRWEREIFLSGFEGAETFVPYRLAIGKNRRIYATGLSIEGMIVLDTNGVFQEMITPQEDGKPVKLTNVNIDRGGRVYLTSMEEGRIYVYDEDMDYLFKFGEKGGGPGKLSRPAGVAVDREGNLMYVTDTMRHTVNVYDVGGKYLFEFGGLGWGDEWFQYPRDLTVDKTGRLLVADTFNNRISVYFPGTEIIDSKRERFLADKFKGRITLRPPTKKQPLEGRIIDRIKDKMTKLRDKDMSLNAPGKQLKDFFDKDEEALVSDIFKSRVQLKVPGKEAGDKKRFPLISGISYDGLTAFHASSEAPAGYIQ